MDRAHEVASSAGKDVATRRMRKAGRTKWSREDYNAAVAEYNRVHPEPSNV